MGVTGSFEYVTDLAVRVAVLVTLRQRQRSLALLLLLVGLGLALAGVLTFRAPTCTGGSLTAPASCSAWETSQWLMIAGALLATVGLLWLARQKIAAAQREPSRETPAPSTQREGSG